MMVQAKIRVLVFAETSQDFNTIVQCLDADDQLEVMGRTTSGPELFQRLNTSRPDIILMLVDTPDSGDFETIRTIMETNPVPLVISPIQNDALEASMLFQVSEAGALACIHRPLDRESAEYSSSILHLLRTLKLMAEVKVVRRWPRLTLPGNSAAPSITPGSSRSSGEIEIVGIGASTGGPPVLQRILSLLPQDFPVPLLIVQHIAPGFLSGLAEWLEKSSGFKIQIAAHGEQAKPGIAYLAPDSYHMQVGSNKIIHLNKDAADEGLIPSINRLFRSLGDHFGSRAAGVLLTGMGKDGALALKYMKDRGGITLVQDRATSVVFGMPGEAVALDAATFILPADHIADQLISLVKRP